MEQRCESLKNHRVILTQVCTKSMSHAINDKGDFLLGTDTGRNIWIRCYMYQHFLSNKQYENEMSTFANVQIV